jgi:hypothetical protein
LTDREKTVGGRPKLHLLFLFGGRNPSGHDTTADRKKRSAKIGRFWSTAHAKDKDKIDKDTCMLKSLNVH